MRAELLTIGSELTLGVTVNINAAFLGRRLAEAGIACDWQSTVSDERALLLKVMKEALSRCDLLIMTGGLGPTFDDVTVEVLAEAVGRPLQLVPAAAATIRRFYAQRHRRLQKAALRQAQLPQGAVALPNPIGTAPGVWLQTGHRLVVALPGVPSEMRAIMDNSVMPRLKKLQQSRIIFGRTLRTIGLVELEIQALLDKLVMPAHIQAGLYPSSRMVDIRLTTQAASKKQAEALLRPVEIRLRRKLGQALYGYDATTLEESIGALLLKRRLTVAIAESCTGGLVMDRLTNTPGSSAYLRGGVVAYHNDLKKRLLGVKPELLLRYGAVSAQTARAMAAGIRHETGASIGISVTGIAGPAGATSAKPVGLVYIGLSDKRKTHTPSRHLFFGDRQSIKTQAAQTALNTLRHYLLNANSSKIS